MIFRNKYLALIDRDSVTVYFNKPWWLVNFEGDTETEVPQNLNLPVPMGIFVADLRQITSRLGGGGERFQICAGGEYSSVTLRVTGHQIGIAHGIAKAVNNHSERCPPPLPAPSQNLLYLFRGDPMVPEALKELGQLGVWPERLQSRSIL